MPKPKATRRIKLAVGLSVPLIFIGVWLLARTSLRPEAFRQIRNGMTQAEVEALLGGPPGNYGRFSWGVCMCTQEAFSGPPGSVEKIWCDDTHQFGVCFDNDNRVTGTWQRAEYQQRLPITLSDWTDCIRRLFGR